MWTWLGSACAREALNKNTNCVGLILGILTFSERESCMHLYSGCSLVFCELKIHLIERTRQQLPRWTFSWMNKINRKFLFYIIILYAHAFYTIRMADVLSSSRQILGDSVPFLMGMLSAVHDHIQNRMTLCQLAIATLLFVVETSLFSFQHIRF